MTLFPDLPAGFASNPAWSVPPYQASTDPFRALEFHYIPLNSVMTGPAGTFDWTALEDKLSAGAGRSMHSAGGPTTSTMFDPYSLTQLHAAAHTP